MLEERMEMQMKKQKNRSSVYVPLGDKCTY